MIDHPLLKNFFLSLTIISVPYVVLAEKSELWITPMTEYGHPDLQGSWTNPYQTPLERPTELGGQRAYTPDQAQALIDYARELDAARREPAAGPPHDPLPEPPGSFSGKDPCNACG